MNTTSRFPHLRVLVIEDNIASVNVIESILLCLSCDFEIVDNYHLGIELHNNDPFHIIIMDIMASQIEASETVQTIKSMPYPACKTPIIALLSSFTQKNHVKWLNQGIAHFLEKPLKIKELEEVFNKSLSGVQTGSISP